MVGDDLLKIAATVMLELADRTNRNFGNFSVSRIKSIILIHFFVPGADLRHLLRTPDYAARLGITAQPRIKKRRLSKEDASGSVAQSKLSHLAATADQKKWDSIRSQRLASSMTPARAKSAQSYDVIMEKTQYDLYNFMQYVLLPLSNRKLDLVDTEVYDDIDEILQDSGNYTKDPNVLKSKLEQVMRVVASSTGKPLRLHEFITAFVGNFIYSEMYDQTDFLCRMRIGDQNFCELDSRCGMCKDTGLCRTKDASRQGNSLAADRSSQKMVHMYMRRTRGGEWKPVATVKLFAYPFLRLPTPPVIKPEGVRKNDTEALQYMLDDDLFADFTNLSSFDKTKSAASLMRVAARHVETSTTTALLNMTVTVLQNYATAMLTLALASGPSNKSNVTANAIRSTILPLIREHMDHVGMGYVTEENLVTVSSQLKVAA